MLLCERRPSNSTFAEIFTIFHHEVTNFYNRSNNSSEERGIQLECTNLLQSYAARHVLVG